MDDSVASGTETDYAEHDVRTPKGVEKQLDYILVDKKHYCWSRDAEANDMMHMGSEHRCVMATFVIPAKAKKMPLHSETTPKRTHGRTRCLETKAEHEFEARYQDLEEEILAVGQGIS